MIHFVVALFPEAKPLIEFYKLKPLSNSGTFKVYEHADKRLIVSGIGKDNSAKASEFLHTFSGSNRSQIWLNIGIAGHATRPLGEGIIAHKITDAATQKSWYPPIVIETPYPTDSILTVLRPENEYDFSHKGDRSETRPLYDMEAAGFYAAATRFSTAELVHCFKVISDNKKSSSRKVTAKLAENLISQNLHIIDELVQKLNELRAKLPGIQISEEELGPFFSKWHFTVSEQHRLRRLLTRLKTLEPDSNRKGDRSKTCPLFLDSSLGSAKDVLTFLEDKINLSPVSF